MVEAAHSAVVPCPGCGALPVNPIALRLGSVVTCGTCKTEVVRNTGRSLSAATAFAAATFLLLFPANLLPFLTTSVAGVSRGSRLISGAQTVWREGFPALGLAIGLCVVVLPFLRFGLLTFVLGALQLGRRPPGLGAAFRAANRLQTWAMPDVYLLALWVAFARLKATIPTDLEVGAKCYIAVGVLALFTRATLDKAAVWRLIASDREPSRTGAPCVTCPACNLILPEAGEGDPCPRCGHRVHGRTPQSISRAAALTLAGVILYAPANVYPFATLPIDLKPTSYNILGGVVDLLNAKLIGLAALVFTASFVIPFLKLVGLAVCITSVLRRSTKRLRLKTRLYRIVKEIGRWSMVDPFVIACFVPVTQYNALIRGGAQPAAFFFTVVVILTIIAADQFDPRLMWDAGREGS